MNCRPGDLAVVVRCEGALACLNGKFVRLAKESPVYIGSTAYWRLEEPFVMSFPEKIVDAWCRVIEAGQRGLVSFMADANLRPIRDPGKDAVDEMLIYAGNPRVREVSHG